jgi:two-component SAPR family response regulator
VLDYGIARRVAGPRILGLREEAVASLYGVAEDGLSIPAQSKHATVGVNPVKTPESATGALSLRAWALGRSRVQCVAGSTISRTWRGDKSKELIFYLLCNPGWQRRERIQDQIWTAGNESQLRQAFHSALYRLRRTLGADLIQEDQGRYRLNPATTVWFDAGEFERRCASSDPVNSSHAANELSEVLDLYRGGFLEDLAPEWARPIHARLEALFTESCIRLANYHAACGEHGVARQLALRVLAVDPASGDAQALLERQSAAQADAAATGGAPWPPRRVLVTA